jgi:hypothetical protein
MSYPDKPIIAYSYTGFSAGQGGNLFPGSQLDNDIAALRTSLGDTIDFIKLFATSDGRLSALAADNLAGVTETIAAITELAADAQASANAAAVSAATISTSGYLAAAGNLAGLADIAAARTNLGLSSFATKTSIALNDVGDGIFLANATGRGKFASGFVNLALVGDGIFTADATGRGKFASKFVDYSLVDDGMQIGFSNAVAGAAANGAFTTSTATTPATDDTIPQITEGTEVLTATYTPKLATSKLLVSVILPISTSATASVKAALFRDALADALAADVYTVATAGYAATMILRAVVTSGSTSATTFRVRVGVSTGTVTINGSAGARWWGGVAQASITVTEIKA